MFFETFYDSLMRLSTVDCDYDASPTALFTYIESCEWQKCIERCRTDPSEASVWVKRVNKSNVQMWMVLPLHAAIVSNCPSSVVEALLRAYPDGARERDDQRNLPLHLVANSFDPDDGVIHALIETYPEAILKMNPNGGLSLNDYDVNCPQLFKLIQEKKWSGVLQRLQTHPTETKSWVLRREDFGNIRWRLLPIHAAVIFKAPGEIVDALLEVFPQAAKCVDDEGMTPLQRQLNKAIKDKSVVDSLNRAMVYPHEILTFHSSEHTAADFDVDCPLLYRLIQMKDWEKVMSRVCTNPEEIQLWVERKSHAGNVHYRHLPLHLVLALQPPPVVVEALLTGYPDAIRCRDDKGLLPFQIALVSGSNEVVNTLLDALENPTGICMKDAHGGVVLTNYDIYSSELYEMIEGRCWDDCIEQLITSPEEAKTWVLKMHPNGTLLWRMLPIHAAIMNEAPHNVVESLIEAYPDGAKCRDNQGMLPLHLAQWKNSRLDVVETLATAWPESLNASKPPQFHWQTGLTKERKKDSDGITLAREYSFNKESEKLKSVTPLFRRTPSGLKAKPVVLKKSRSLNSISLARSVSAC